MDTQQEKVFLVIPCYNEAGRLDFKKFNAAGSNCHFLFVNDGSTDNTLELLRANAKENMHILSLEKNSGKAEAVRRGMLHLKTIPAFSGAGWAGYWDADISTPLYEVDNFLLYAKVFYPRAQAIFGSRVERLGSVIQRFLHRHLLGRLFVTVISENFKLTAYDTQCGAKLFRTELIDRYFAEPFISNWMLDVELLLRMKGIEIIEYPLKEWRDIQGSKLKLFRTAIEVIRGISALKRKYRG
jgi:dolichyl-phosphate beta-glucosyltransferase